MTRDECLMAVVVLSFATLVTAHVTLVFGLARRAPRWRAAVAALVAPLAPFWGIKARMLVRAGLWIASAVVYLVARSLAGR
jgi:hypothetical protein